MKKSMKKKLIIIIIIAVLVFIIALLIIKNNHNNNNNNNNFYRVMMKEEYYDLNNDYTIFINNKSIFDKYIDELEDFDGKLDFHNHDYLLCNFNSYRCIFKINSLAVDNIKNNVLTLDVNYDSGRGLCSRSNHYYLMEIDKGLMNQNTKVVYNYINSHKHKIGHNCVVYKPIIYVYPEEDIDVSIKLGKENNLLISYPVYNKGWEFYAKTNGDLIDKNTNRTYYGLYWEAKKENKNKIRDIGFIVEKENTISFLEDKLAILGLNEREINEFIIYWLPKLQENNYNYIYFETIDEINDSMPLIINPEPDSLIRIVMEFKGLNNKINVKEQILEPVVRKGYSVIEWGGTIIN